MSAVEQAGRYMDTRTIMRELGITRNAAEAFMRELPKVQLPGTAKNYVLRADLEQAERDARKRTAA